MESTEEGILLLIKVPLPSIRIGAKPNTSNLTTDPLKTTISTPEKNKKVDTTKTFSEIPKSIYWYAKDSE